MTVTFLDMEDPANELNGALIQESDDLIHILESSRARPPFLCKLTSDKGHYLDIGVGKDSCAQHTRAGGMPPYLMAVAPGKDRLKEDWANCTEFLCGGTPTPIPDRFCMPFETVREIVQYFAETGEPHPAFSWDPI